MKTEAANHRIASAADLNNITDIQNIHINKNLPPRQRIRDYFGKVGDPYHFSVNGATVTIRFNGEKSLTDCLADALKQQCHCETL